MDIVEPLKKYVTEELLSNSIEVDEDDSLLAEGMVDSIGMIRLVTYVEELVGFKIPQEDLLIENFETIRVIAEYIYGKARDQQLPG